MAFKYSCFVKKNTEELRKKLKKFGLKHLGRDKDTIGNSALFTVGDGFYSVYPVKPARHYAIFDCGDNEDLFLALSAVRDDSDKYQWFISLEDTYNLDIEPINAGDWQYNDRYSKLPRRLRGIWKKATYKEIIAHFSKS